MDTFQSNDSIDNKANDRSQTSAVALSDKDWSGFSNIRAAMQQSDVQRALPSITINEGGGCTGSGGLTGQGRPQRDPDAAKNSERVGSDSSQSNQPRDKDAYKIQGNGRLEAISIALEHEQSGGCAGPGGLTGIRPPRRDPDGLKEAQEQKADAKKKN